MIVNVVWPSYQAPTSFGGSWDMGLLMDVFDKYTRNLFSEEEITYVHRERWSDLLPSDVDGAVVVLPGQHHVEYYDVINHDIAQLKWVVFILLGDEESLFNLDEIKHPNMRVWAQSRATSMSDKVSHHLPWGYPQDARAAIAKFPDEQRWKKMDVFFAGQMTHARRLECRDAIVEMQRQGKHKIGFWGTPGFTQGYGREEYYFHMCEAKIVPCPAGVITPDSFRVWEALEAGAIPIVDELSSRPGQWAHWWETLIGERPYFAMISDWETLPEVVDYILGDYEHLQQEVLDWWVRYKNRLALWMYNDIIELKKAI